MEISSDNKGSENGHHCGDVLLAKEIFLTKLREISSALAFAPMLLEISAIAREI